MSRRNQWRVSENNRWSGGNFKRPRPPGLVGKQIGLFYRDQYKRKKNAELSISLNIPWSVVSKLASNLEQIKKLAKEHGIEVSKNASKFKPKSNSLHGNDNFENKTAGNLNNMKSKDERTTESDQTKGPNIKIKSDPEPDVQVKREDDDDDLKDCNVSQIKIEPGVEIKVKNDEIANKHRENPIKQEFDCKSEPSCDDDDNVKEPNLKQIKLEPRHENTPGTSSMSDFIPISTELPDYGHSGERILNLRDSSFYKYGYNDIITGTFPEKLEESLAKGITIAKTNSDISSLNIALYENYQNKIAKSQYQKMMQFRNKLPTYKKRDELKSMIDQNQIVVISGETGCGKSTQVPQIILDDALQNKKGGNIKILVTQPRRIAASSLAARVASERAEAVGESVGYAVRLEKVEARPRGSIMFCTTGVLLVDLEINQGLTDYSHVILDEVHERDVHIDLALCMLKQVLEKRKDLKLILMSATLDAEKLCSFFNDCPLIHIEGLAYPVKDIYLEDILQLIDFRLPEVPPQGNRNERRQLQRGKKFREISEKAIQYRAFVAPWLESIKKNIKREAYYTLQDLRVEELNIDLLFEVIKYITRGPPGAILVFLPGIGEISKLMKTIGLRESEMGGQYEMYPLHSKLPTLEQHKIFQRPPENIRKIIIATNIAETSITIDDIVYVVDCGKIKYNGLNVEQHMNTLKVEWVAQANMRQRRGRAGRCQPGVCYHLVTSYRASQLQELLQPELQRSDLLEPLLSIKRLRLGKALDALKKVPDSPAEATIERAVKHLQQCGALDANETLTPLGWHLARLPVHPSAGKLLLFGALFGCLNRAASVAAVWSFKDPFILVLEKESEMKAAKRELALGEASDHVVLSEAIIEWESLSPRERKGFTYDYFLSPSTLQLLSEMKAQLGNNLKQMGFLATGDVRAPWENRHSDNLSLFKAVVAAALYPNIAAAVWTNMAARNPYKQIRVKANTPDGFVHIHPSSVMCPPQLSFKGHRGPKVQICAHPGANWMVYWLKQKSSEVFLIDVTLVYTLPLLFFGELQVSDAEDDRNCYVVSISSYKVKIEKKIAEYLFELRGLLDDVLASKIMMTSAHAVRHNKFEEEVLNAVIQLITAEDENTEYLHGSESDASDVDSRY